MIQMIPPTNMGRFLRAEGKGKGVDFGFVVYSRGLRAALDVSVYSVTVSVRLLEMPPYATWWSSIGGKPKQSGRDNVDYGVCAGIAVGNTLIA